MAILGCGRQKGAGEGIGWTIWTIWTVWTGYIRYQISDIRYQISDIRYQISKLGFEKEEKISPFGPSLRYGWQL
jgi:hypothetical protein